MQKNKAGSGPGGFTHDGAKILILDDERSILEMLGEILRLLGYTPVLCDSPEKALALLEECSFDVILSDFRMPKMNGEEFYRAAVEKNPVIARRIVFLTGDAVHDETRVFLKTIGNQHLGKPFHLSSVEEVISQVLHGQASLAA